MSRIPSISRRAASRRQIAARAVTEACAPWVCVLAALIAVATQPAADELAMAIWATVAAIFCAGVPMAYIVRGVRAKKWDDHHIGERDQRLIPLLVGATSVAVVVVLLITLHAPRPLLALVIAMLAGLVIVVSITHWWKVSIHAAVAAGLLGTLLVLFGPWAWLSLLIVIAVGWSRTVLKAHTWLQIAVGAAVGWLAAIVIFPLLR